MKDEGLHEVDKLRDAVKRFVDIAEEPELRGMMRGYLGASEPPPLPEPLPPPEPEEPAAQSKPRRKSKKRNPDALSSRMLPIMRSFREDGCEWPQVVEGLKKCRLYVITDTEQAIKRVWSRQPQTYMQIGPNRWRARKFEGPRLRVS